MEIITPTPGAVNTQIYRVEMVKPKNKFLFRFVKRSFDLIVSLLLLVLLLLPILIVVLIIRIDSEGPAFYCQERLGKNGKPFVIYKFRTMVLGAEGGGPRWAEDDDSRCTKVGRFLRRCRIDEFPQLLNVIRGDMSLVGPRPEREYFYDEFEKYIDGFRYRLAVRPGITGLAQVNGGYDLRPEEKIVYDMEYIEKMSLRLDLLCIFKTVKILFTHEGAR